ncbi:serine/threonine-protein kinase, partial [Amycolatopsis sp. NPDC054798]
ALVALPPGLSSNSGARVARWAGGYETGGWPPQQRAGLVYRAIVPTQQGWQVQPDSDSSGSGPNRKIYCVLSRASNDQIPARITAKVK